MEEYFKPVSAKPICETCKGDGCGRGPNGEVERRLCNDCAGSGIAPVTEEEKVRVLRITGGRTESHEAEGR